MSILTKALILLGLVAAIIGYVVVSEHRVTSATHRAEVAEGAESILAGRLVQSKVSEKVVTRYVDRVQVVHEVGATLIRKVPVYVTAHDDAACTLPLGFVRLHDAAAAATALPDTAGAADAQPSGVALSAATGTIIHNYTTCHATAAQVVSLQDWIRANTEPEPAK
jgi:hypothetical protein